MRALLLAIWLGSLGIAPALAQDAAQTTPVPTQKTAPAAPSSKPTALDVKLAEAIVYYYVNKDPAALFPVFVALREPGAVGRTGLSRASLAGFLSMVFLQNRSRLEGWIGTGTTYPSDAKSVLVFALWQSGNADLIAPLFHEQPDFINAKPGNLYTLTPRSGVEMDLKWGAFFATGNPGFVAAMADALDVGRPLTGSRELDSAIRSTSATGLAMNMRQHEVLERYLRQRALEASGSYKQALLALLARREADYQPAPDHDGDFAGSIATLKLPEKPDLQSPAIAGLDATKGPQTARRGETIGVTLLFSGMALADDLSADVSYDIKVTEPDGTIDPSSSQTGVAALKEKVPARFNVLDSRSTFSIHFEPGDKVGPYRIDVLLKDNIGGKKVALTRSIELLDK
jgi:hypothetical protein